jgi:peptidoglycan/LPS O-acetylase OafA/YrhL
MIRGRNHALDGIRGLLALSVLVAHLTPFEALQVNGRLAAWGFFILSGMVLAPGYDGQYGRFLLRRAVRLLPMYVICVGAAYLLDPHPMAEFFWMPEADPPAWSLCIEMAAMFFMPLIVWARTHIGWAALACIAGLLSGVYVLHQAAFYGSLFLAGAAMSHLAPRNRLLESPLPQYLGAISYPLYLSHWVVIAHVPGPLWLKVVAAFLVAHVLTITVERWSIEASRMVWRPVMPRLGEERR